MVLGSAAGRFGSVEVLFFEADAPWLVGQERRDDLEENEMHQFPSRTRGVAILGAHTPLLPLRTGTTHEYRDAHRSNMAFDGHTN